MILVDTDILIKVFRGNVLLKKQIDKIHGKFGISVITVFELYEGANSQRKIQELNKQLKVYQIFYLNEEISLRAIQLYKLYKSKKNLYVADTLIAATAIENNLELFTENKKDYDFINELKFYQPK